MPRRTSREDWFITIEIRNRAASLALWTTVGLMAGKMAVGYVSGSVGVMSEGIHSLLDLVSAAVAYFTVREAGKPADDDHPFGHGKIETLSSLFESLLLVAAAGWIIYEGIDHLLNPQPIQHQGLAIATIFISMVISYFVFRQNSRAARETESSAIHVNALHFLSDVVASAGVLVGLIVLKFTGWQIVDPIMAFTVAAYILLISLKQVRVALLELSDSQLPESEIRAIQEVIGQFKNKIIEAHDLRTRKSGSTRHVDFHMVVCGQTTVTDSHELCDTMEERIMDAFPRASVNIHVEPCSHENVDCHENCPYKKRSASGRVLPVGDEGP